MKKDSIEIGRISIKWDFFRDSSFTWRVPISWNHRLEWICAKWMWNWPMIVGCAMCTVNLADRCEYSAKTIGPSYRLNFAHTDMLAILKILTIAELVELMINFPFYLLEQNTARSVSVDFKLKMYFFDNCQSITAVRCAPISDIWTNTVKKRDAFSFEMKIIRLKSANQQIFSV